MNSLEVGGDASNPNGVYFGAYLPKPPRIKFGRGIILGAFIEFPEEIQCSVLFGAVQMTEELLIEGITSEKAEKVNRLLKICGVQCNSEQKDSGLLLDGFTVVRSEVHHVVLPDVLRVTERYVLLRHCSEVVNDGKGLMISDIRMGRNLSGQELSLGNITSAELESRFVTSYGRTSVNHWTSADVFFGVPQRLVPEDSYTVIDTNGQVTWSNSLRFPVAFWDVAKFIELGERALDLEIRGFGAEKKPFVSNRKIVVVVVEAGFREDGIDLLLKAFSKLEFGADSISLRVFYSSPESLLSCSYPLHNQASRKTKIEPLQHRFIAECIEIQEFSRKNNAGVSVEIVDFPDSIVEFLLELRSSSLVVAVPRYPRMPFEILAAIRFSVPVVCSENTSLSDSLWPIASKIRCLDEYMVDALNAEPTCRNVNRLVRSVEVESLAEAIFDRLRK